MQGKRLDRVSELIKQCLGLYILTKLRDPRLGFVTITHVTVTPDLKLAKVYYTVLGDEKSRKGTAAALGHARGFLQKEISNEVKIRTTPILSFIYDETIHEKTKIESILKKIHEEEKGSAPSE